MADASPSSGGAVSFTDTNAETKKESGSKMGESPMKNGMSDDEREKKELDDLNNDGDESAKDGKGTNKKKRKQKKRRKTAHFKKRGSPAFKVVALTLSVLALLSFITSMVFFGLLISDVMREA